jgi:fatty acid desaturase
MASVYLAWTLLIAAGAWLTGQHYLIDLVTGIAFGAAMALAVNALLGAAVTLGTSEATERAPAGEPLAPASSPARPRRRIERPLLHPASALALGLEWLFILGAAAAALLWWSAPVALAAGLVIATRQHALLVLYHDAVHGLIARRRRLNDFVINTAVGVPLLLPVHLYRALHISHHRLLGTARDPERVLLYRGQRWSYRPLPMGSLALQLLGDLLGWNAVVLAWRYFAERRRGGGLRLPRTRAYPELAAQYALFAALWIAAAVLWPAVALRVAALWFLPYLTLTQLLQKVRSFAEHTDDADRHARSCSWAPGLLGRLTIWPYNINYHREHHARPDVPWNRLPAAFPAARQRPGAALRAHLWSGASR